MSKKYLVGNTIRFTWISSGITPSAIHVAVYNGLETLVSSSSMVSSGNGHFYSNYTTPDSSGYFVGETIAVISGNNYKNRTVFKTVRTEVD